MLKNYFQIAFRTLVKNKVYSFINILGLAVSLTASVLLLLWVWNEVSFDKFNSNVRRIYIPAATFDKDHKQVWTTTPAPLATFAKQQLSAVEDVARISENNDILTEYNHDKFTEEKTSYVDPSFFKVLDFPLISGNKTNPFPDNRSIVIDQSTAKKYFGNEEAIGKVVKINNKDNYTVSGFIKDMPENSSFRYSILLPFDVLKENYYGNPQNKSLEDDWGNYNYIELFLLKKDNNATSFGKQLADMHRKNQQEEFIKDLYYIMQPLEKRHLYTASGEDNGAQVVKIFFIVAMVILLIACINYVNLVTARATKRVKEVSVRKVIGAGRIHLFWQFIIESVVVFMIALILAIFLTYTVMPLYNDLSGKHLVFSLFDAKVLVLFGGAFLATILLAGVYPAFTLSAFNPALAIKGLIPGLGRNASFRKTLVVIQFTCSIVLIISTVIIGQQLNYIRTKNLGFTKENVLSFNSRNFTNNYDAIKTELEKQSGILGITAASNNIMNIQSSTGDADWDGKGPELNNFMISQLDADRNFLQVMNLQLVSGTGFTGTPADSSNYLLNESAVQRMHISNPIGKRFTFHNRKGVIAGVVKDFHFQNMRNNIEPCVISYKNFWNWWRMYIKTAPGKEQQALASVKKLWKQYNPDYNFDYKFLDDGFDELYRSDIRVGQLFNCFATIAIIISCLGLFGLVTYTAETKVKEIGIRKTLGANAANIIMLLSKDFMKLVLVSFVVSFPLAWFMMSRWLTNYAYRTSLQWWVFAIAGFGALVIAFITVSSKAFRAAQSNPVISLRSE